MIRVSKTGLLIVLFCISMLISETLVYAKNELPDFKLPDLDPLETPKLFKDYDEMIKELQEEGLDKYKFGENKENLEYPEVELPEGTGKKAFEKFKEKYGDMWNDPERQLDKSSIIPDEEFFDAVRDFGKANEKNFNGISQADREVMAGLLKKKLNTNFLWDMKKEKEKMSKKLIDTKGYLEGVKKPANWDSIKKQSYAVKKPSLPANQVQRANRILNLNIQDIANHTFTQFKKTLDDLGVTNFINKLGEFVNDPIGNFKKWIGEGGSEELKGKEQEIKSKKQNNESLSDKDLREYKEKLKNETKQRINNLIR